MVEQGEEIEIDYSLFSNIELRNVEDDVYVVQHGERMFNVGNILFDILNQLKEGVNLATIRQSINEKFNISLDHSKIREVVSDAYEKFDNEPKNKFSLYMYIYGRLSIIKEEPLKAITTKFIWLFNKWLIPIIFLATLVGSFIFAGHIITIGLFDVNLDIRSSWKYILMAYAFIISAGLFHEIGHSAASAKYNIYSKEVGFGFFIVFPIFYTDVSRIWLLPRNQRIVVNLGGVYFQGMINLVLIAIFFAFDHSTNTLLIIKTLFILNTFMCFYSLNPFLRNDGYWIYSDFFRIPNLALSARRYPGQFINKFIRNKEGISGLEKRRHLIQDLPLLIYSIFYNFVMTFIWVGLIFFTYINFQLVFELLGDEEVMSNLGDSSNLFRIGSVIFSCFINLYFMYRTGRFFIPQLIAKFRKKKA